MSEQNHTTGSGEIEHPFDAATLAFYGANAETYAQARPGAIAPELIPFLGNLQTGARILELGCGSGYDAAAMEQLGFVVDPTDGVAAMAAQASQRLGRPVRVMRFDELAALGEYDAVVACASLLHAPRASLPKILSAILTALKPGGWHFASFKTAGPEGYDVHGRYYNYLTQEDAAHLYARAGDWASVDYALFDGVGYFSAPARWLTVTTAKKSA